MHELKNTTPGKTRSQQTVLEISGMSCASCASHVESALNKVEGVIGASVPNWQEKIAFVSSQGNLSPEQLLRAIEKAGYKARLSGPFEEPGVRENSIDESIAACAIPATAEGDGNDVSSSCCTTSIDSPQKAACPNCGEQARKAQHKTLENLLKRESRARLSNDAHYYCDNPECPVVYFSIGTGAQFMTGDLAVRVNAKDPGDDVPVCYCFDWTRGRIKQQIAATGQSSAAQEITREIRAGNCRCEINNPKGDCCLGDVNRFVKVVLTDETSF